MIDEDKRSPQSTGVADETQVGEQIVDELLEMISGAIPPTVFGEATWHRKW